MKISMQPILMLSAALLLSPVALAQAPITGKVDLDPIAAEIGQAPKVNLNFGSAMVQVFAETLRSSNSEIAGVMENISGVRVMVYEDVDGALVRDRVSEIADQLERLGWTPAMEVRDEDADVDLYLAESQETIDGLVLMLTESDGAAVFINVHGVLDPVVIGKLIGQGGDVLKGLDLQALAGQFQPGNRESGSGDGS